MSKFVQPKTNKKYQIGIVPHYVDYKAATELLSGIGNDVTLIDVKQDPESFISKITECESIASSSLHGLILADAYNIPNIWIEFSNLVVGKGWKFMDYYSTTSNKTPKRITINSNEDLVHMIKEHKRYRKVSEYMFDVEKMQSSLPIDIFR